MLDLSLLQNNSYLKSLASHITPQMLEYLTKERRLQITQKSDTVIQLRFGNTPGQYMSYAALADGISISASYVGGLEEIPELACIPENMGLCVIHYCTSGQCEIHVQDGKYAYMKPGILCIEWKQHTGKTFNFYGENYSGIEILMDFDLIPEKVREAFQEFGIDLKSYRKENENDSDYYIGIVSNRFKVFANDLFDSIHDGTRDRFTYLAALINLLNMIRTGEINTDTNKVYLTKGQRRIVQEIHDNLTNALASNISIAELAKKYDISTVSLNKYFEIMYGDTISRYMQSYKMSFAANKLSSTKESIADIALSVGYESQSKFGTAFKKRFHQTPLEYRRCNKGV